MIVLRVTYNYTHRYNFHTRKLVDYELNGTKFVGIYTCSKKIRITNFVIIFRTQNVGDWEPIPNN